MPPLSAQLLYGCILYIVLCMPITGSSQIDTLVTAKKLNSGAKYQASLKLLSPYYKQHSCDLNTAWLYAQTLYWNKQFKKAQQVYDEAIKTHPENYYLLLDYGLKLIDIGELDKGKACIDQYLDYDSNAAEALVSLGKLYYWRGDYQASKNEINKALTIDSNNTGAKELNDELQKAQLPWLKTGVTYNTDDQPLQTITPIIEAGVYISPLVSLQFGVQTPVYIRDSKIFNAQWLQAGNQFKLNKGSLLLCLNAGIIRLPDDKISGTGNIELAQTFIKRLVVSAQVEHTPYIYTRANLSVSIMQLHYATALAWNNPNSWQGKISLDVNHFYTDKNVVYAAGLWVMAPPLKVSVLQFKFGYGYGFSTANKNTFKADKAINEIIANWNSSTTISGIYSPYFTPYNQSVHSAIIAISINPVKNLAIGIKGNIGFYGNTKSPYLYLDTDESGATYIHRSFTNKIFFPAAVNSYISYNITKFICIKAGYDFMYSNFYTSHSANLGLKVSFSNAKKAK